MIEAAAVEQMERLRYDHIRVEHPEDLHEIEGARGLAGPSIDRRRAAFGRVLVHHLLPRPRAQLQLPHLLSTRGERLVKA